MRKPVADLVQDLVAIPSVSATSNRAVLDYVAGCLDPRQWTIQTYPYTDAAGMPKANLLALTRNASGPSAELAFVCHSDTVPFDPAWEAAVHPEVRDGRIYGRGSCDVKGFLACVLAAVEDLDLARLRKPLALIVTADEEVGCLGAKRLAAARPFSTRYLLIGEPTCLRPVRAGKGYALAIITVRGQEAHSAFPAAGRSAIYDAARVISVLDRLAGELEKEQDPAFAPPFTTLNVGLVEGGAAKNIVPGQCRLTVEWRPIPGADPRRVPERITEELAELRKSFPGFTAELQVLRMEPPFAPSPTHRLQDLLTGLTGQEATTIAFGSEAVHLSTLAQEVIVMGPGDMTTAHKTGEFVPVEELAQCVACLRAAIEQLCG